MATSLSTARPASNKSFLWPIWAHNPNGIWIGSAVFLHRWAQNVSALYHGMPFPPSKLPLCIGGSGPLSNTWFLGPTRVLNPNGILIGAAVFAGVTSVTDRRTNGQTDRATRSVTIGRIYVRSTLMRPKNTKTKPRPKRNHMHHHSLLAQLTYRSEHNRHKRMPTNKS